MAAELEVDQAGSGPESDRMRRRGQVSQLGSRRAERTAGSSENDELAAAQHRGLALLASFHRGDCESLGLIGPAAHESEERPHTVDRVDDDEAVVDEAAGERTEQIGELPSSVAVPQDVTRLAPGAH